MMNVSDYQAGGNDFAHLSLRDLLDAREQYHVFLARHPNVVATAVGRYRIRKADDWPTKDGPGKRHGTGPRTLASSEVRPYSWPAVLVFVERWEAPSKRAAKDDALVPRTLFLPDGRRVPVCVIEAPKELVTEQEARDVRWPINNLGGGSAILANVQGREYAATVACLVTDGHQYFALTNRHVVGGEGEIIYSRKNGSVERVGIASPRHLARVPFTDLYPGWPGRNVYVNVDVGLVSVDDIGAWSADVREIGTIGPMVDVSVENLTLSLVGCHVRGSGAASGVMKGEIQALFYQYKHNGGFEYVADLLIGPRRDASPKSFQTLPGDSGTLWLLDPVGIEDGKSGAKSRKRADKALRPIAMQWGRNMLRSAGAAAPEPYVLATFLSRVCAQLDVDPVRGWNIGQDDTWGSVGHFAIGNRAVGALSSPTSKLGKLMTANATIISHDDKTIESSKFTGLGSAAFVPMADVPDWYWKPRIAQQGYKRRWEGPNHFADMDQPDASGTTLLDLCEDDANIDPVVWDRFYDSVRDLLKDEKIKPEHRGLLPFRVWQIFDAMVDFASHTSGAAQFVCAGGVLAHYLGDACQPLHISYLHDGDPLRAYTYTFQSGKHAGETEKRPLGMGVHSAYEDTMINHHRKDILGGLAKAGPVKKDDLVTNGFEAAKATIALMRRTFSAIPPMDIVNAYVATGGGQSAAVSDALWAKFRKPTLAVMTEGTYLLAVLWESAWKQGGGKAKVGTTPLTQARAMKICQDPGFLPSMPIDQIGAVLKKH